MEKRLCRKCNTEITGRKNICPNCYTKWMPQVKKTPTGQKPLDYALDVVEDQMVQEAAQKKKMKPILDKQLMEVQKIDNKIHWFEEKIKELESDKQSELRKMDDLMDLAMVSSHSLSNGYTVKPDNKRKIEVTNIRDFMMWLKENCEPQEVIEFFKDAMKIVQLKSFCNKKANEQRLKGQLEPKIDGVEFGEITFRRLTTVKEKK